MRRDLNSFLILQIMAAIVALLSFRFIAERWQAALVAGGFFVFVGVWMVLKTLRWNARFRALSFYFARIHLWIFALPMLLLRLRNVSQDFSHMHFFGIPAPMFHRVSEIVFLTMVLATIIDLWRVRSGKLQEVTK